VTRGEGPVSPRQAPELTLSPDAAETLLVHEASGQRKTTTALLYRPYAAPPALPSLSTDPRARI